MHTFEIEPEVVAHDLHPGYLSTRWAQQPGTACGCIGVQHHHAHIAACMAEHALDRPVIGLSLDGTGYGTDGHIWGGEVLICSLDGFERFAHLEYVPMPGGEAAIREPWRMAFSHLLAALGDAALQPEVLSVLGASASDGRLLARMVERRINSPLTSSCGRLFDAAAALITGRRKVDYEAQAAIELEGLVPEAEFDSIEGAYPLAILAGSEDWSRPAPAAARPWQLDPGPMFETMLEDKRAGASASAMSLRFHAAVAQGYAALVNHARSLTGITEVCCSGGVFHNRLFTHLLCEKLRGDGFAVFLPVRVSPGDGGLSYGQAVVAAAQLAASRAVDESKSIT